jgi:hypothetical protein
MAAQPGQISVGIGGGEFGRGFYTQYSERNARRWALRVRARLNGPPAVLRLDINDAAYGALIVFPLDLRRALNLTDLLYFWNATRVFATGCCDAIEGPLSGNAQRLQQKFESTKAEMLLNGNQTVRTVI